MRIHNLNNAEINNSEDFGLIPKGRYDLIIVNAEEKIAKVSGNPYISVGFRVLNDDEPSYKGRYVWTNINNNDVGISILKSILVYNNSPLANLEGEVDFDPSSLIGMKVSAKVGIEKDLDDNDRNNVKYFKPVSEEFSNINIDLKTYFSKKNTDLENVSPNLMYNNTEDNSELPF